MDHINKQVDMEKTMTAEEWHKGKTHAFSSYEDLEEALELAEAYANYKARRIIESLTDDEINKKGHDTPRLEIALGRIDGALWAKEQLLSRIK